MKTFDSLIKNREERSNVYVNHMIESLELAGFETASNIGINERFLKIRDKLIFSESHKGVHSVSLHLSVYNKYISSETFVLSRDFSLTMGENTEFIAIGKTVDLFTENSLLLKIDELRMKQLL